MGVTAPVRVKNPISSSPYPASMIRTEAASCSACLT